MEERLDVYIKKINDLIEKNINNNLKQFDLTLSQCRVLGYLNKNKYKKVTQKEIEKVFNITHATVSGIITRLETNKFVKVDRSKRSNVITLLEKSYINEEKVKKYQQNLECILTKGFNEEELELFINNLKRVYANLKEEENNA